MRRLLSGAALALLGLGLVQSPVAAQSVEDFYRGKTVRMLVGYGPGTGNDIYMRVLAHHLGAHIPGKPTIVPENMPGAASLTMINYLYNVAAHDGTVLGMPSRNLLVEPLYGNTLAKFDARKFTWLGSMARDTALCFTWHTSGINTLDDAKTRKVLLGSTGTASPSTLFPNLLNKLFGTQFEPLVGYPDSNAIGLAMERGEVFGYCSFTLAATRSAHPDWLDEKKINILAQMTLTPSPDLKGVPLIMDFAKDETTRQALTFAFGDQEIARPLAGPPDVPADRVAALRKAFDETIKDPEYLAEAKQSRTDLDGPLDGDSVAKVVTELYATPPAVVDVVRSVGEQN
jgi:tripartite-type tricarboxylate transporter receptor subunit TctC